MACFKFLIFSCLSAFAFSSHAAYVNLKPPPGWSQGGSAVSSVGQGLFTSANAAAATSIILGRIGANAALTVAGSEAAIPVALRLGAGAATVAAEFAFGNPYLLVGAGLVVVAPIAYKWFTDQDFEIVDGNWTQNVKVPGELYYVDFPSTRYMTKGAICGPWLNAVGRTYPGSGAVLSPSGDYCVEMKDGSPQKMSSTIRTETSLIDKKVPVLLPEFVSTMAPLKVPIPMFREYPGYVEWPVDLPYIDPLTGEESTSFGRPFLIPTGLPVPTSDPNVWNQPAVRVTPAPTPTSPWRVDVTPVDVPQSDATPKTSEELNPKPVVVIDPVTGAPVIDPVTGLPVTTKPNTGTPTTDKPLGLCAEFPDILACQKLETPESDTLETKDKTIAITPDSGWGSGTGSCPAPRQFSRGEFSFKIYCDFASGIKPVIIAVAWLVAGGILIGFKFGES